MPSIMESSNLCFPALYIIYILLSPKGTTFRGRKQRIASNWHLFLLFFTKMFGHVRKRPYLCTRKQGTALACKTNLDANILIGLWCNGNTADSGPAFPGSSPGSPTEEKRIHHKMDSLFGFAGFAERNSQNLLQTSIVHRSTFNVQRSNTATIPMVMRQFISMQGCRFPSDVTSMSTPTGPSYHGANRGKRS